MQGGYDEENKTTFIQQAKTPSTDQDIRINDKENVLESGIEKEETYDENVVEINVIEQKAVPSRHEKIQACSEEGAITSEIIETDNEKVEDKDVLGAAMAHVNKAELLDSDYVEAPAAIDIQKEKVVEEATQPFNEEVRARNDEILNDVEKMPLCVKMVEGRGELEDGIVQLASEDVRAGNEENPFEIKVNSGNEEEVVNKNLEMENDKEQVTGATEEGYASSEQIDQQKETKEENFNEKNNFDLIEDKFKDEGQDGFKSVYSISEGKQASVEKLVTTLKKSAQRQKVSIRMKEEDTDEDESFFPVYAYQKGGETAAPTRFITEEKEHGNVAIEPTDNFDIETKKETGIVNDNVEIKRDGINVVGEKENDTQHRDELHNRNEGITLNAEIDTVIEKEDEIINLEINYQAGEGGNANESFDAPDRRDSNEIKSRRGWKRKKSKDSEVNNEQVGSEIDGNQSTGSPIQSPFSTPSSQTPVNEEIDSSDQSDCREIKNRRGWKKKVSKDSEDVKVSHDIVVE